VRWLLDPLVAQLNHGGFGAVPEPVAAAAAAVRAEVERNPTYFFTRLLPDRLAAARDELSIFLNADPAGLVFVPNATAGVQTVLASLGLGAGDEIVTTDHAYVAVRRQLAVLADRAGVTVRVVPVPLPVSGPDEVAAAVLGGLGPATRLLVVDHVASPSGLRFPVERLVAAARVRDVPVLVDGAHATGLLPVDLRSLGADFWVGNLHKWLCGPKAAAVLCAAPRWRDVLRPLVPAVGYGEGLHPAFDWTGTADPTPVLAAPTAVWVFGELGWPAVRRRNEALAAEGAALVAAGVGTSLPVPDEMATAMRVVDLGRELPAACAREVERRLADEHQVQVPVTDLGGHRWLRLSAQLYNTIDDYRRLAAVLPGVLDGVG
jgi:isopenicillin-N epimerase